MADVETSDERDGSSPVGRGGAGVYIEGQLGAFYLLSMLAGGEPRGLPGTQLERVQFQAVDESFALDDIVLHGASAEGPVVLEIQSKRTITFAPGDSVFKEVCRQIARTKTPSSVAEQRHGLAVATQRTSFRISGPYQDVLEWARTTGSSASFFARLTTKGVASADMRMFVGAFRANLVAVGVADEDETIWRLLRRFQILEFDFESAAPLARTFAQGLARSLLAPGDMGRAEALWSAAIDMALVAGKTGGSYGSAELRSALVAKGFSLAGDRDFSVSKVKLAEMTKHVLADIGSTVAGTHLSRLDVVQALDEARDGHRLVELRGNPGVGKSAFLKLAADRLRSQTHVLVLDPIRTPGGGWSALALHLGVTATARAFLSDLACSGGGVLFIDSLEMFTSEDRRRTVNDVLREVAAIEGFSVVVTARTDFGEDRHDWLAQDALAALGPAKRVDVGDLTEVDVEILRANAPELRLILEPGHPAAAIARNLYRLTRLLRVPTTASIRSEAGLAEHWWATGSDSEPTAVRPAQRLLADLADAVLAGRQSLHDVGDGLARAALLASLTLREPTRDNLAFYHDVLRDWAIGKRLNEEPNLFAGLELQRPVPSSLARGVEFAARFLLEQADGVGWIGLLGKLSANQAHGSWRRHALLAILRSEVSGDLLEQQSATLLARGGTLLQELCAVVVAVDTVPTVDLLKDLGQDVDSLSQLSRTLRTATGPAGPRLLSWCVAHAGDIPVQALPAVIKLVTVQVFLTLGVPTLGRRVAGMLYDWLLQLDVRKAISTLPSDSEGGRLGDGSRRMVEDLRTLCLLLATQAPERAKAYLAAIADEADTYKIKAIRPVSAGLAQVAPEELAHLIERGLIDRRPASRSYGHGRRDPLGHGDADYLPPSPAQRPFLDLLEASRTTGLGLIRRLAAHVVAFDAAEAEADDGYTLVLESGPRFFPRKDSYFWSRDRGTEHSVASALMALEAWGHDRLDGGDPPQDVIAEVLGPDGSCAAFLLVAVDLIISHWPATREAAVPFMSCPELIATDRGRIADDRTRLAMFDFQSEPAGRVQLKDLQSRPSRGRPLEILLEFYNGDDDASQRVQVELAAAVSVLDDYEAWSNFGDPRFMGVHALSMVTPSNWTGVGEGRRYQPPPALVEHFASLEKGRVEFISHVETEAKISLALTDVSRGSAELAREAIEYADGDLPDDSDPDYLKTRSTRLVGTAMLLARDGDDDLLARHEAWVRAVIEWALTEEMDGHSGSGKRLEYNRAALATCALIHLWRRLKIIQDRDRIVWIAVWNESGGSAGCGAAMEALTSVDPRLAKSVLRAALATSRWRWNAYEEDAAIDEAFKRADSAYRADVLGAEIAWLDGEAEPAWPRFPPKALSVRAGIRFGPREEDEDQSDREVEAAAGDETDGIQVSTETAATWLGVMVEANRAEIDAWLPEVVSAYSTWTAEANGLGRARHVEIENPPTQWNEVFYALAGPVLLNGSEDALEAAITEIESLPDRSFAQTTAILLHAADVWYFNDPDHLADRAVLLRARLVQRTLESALWKRPLSPGSLSIDYDTGPLVAKLLMNTHNPFTGTKSYLVPVVFDRVDALLVPLRSLLPGGPVPFIALCVLNALSVQIRPRHVEFLITGVEAWLTRLPTDPALWLELGTGKRVVEWLRLAAVESSDLHDVDHPLRARIDAVVGRLVALGVPEAYDLEVAINERSRIAG